LSRILSTRNHGAPATRDARSTMRAAVRWFERIALLGTIPAFYLSIDPFWRLVSSLTYAIAAAACIAVMVDGVARRHRGKDSLGLALCTTAALVASAVLPDGDSEALLAVRLGTALLVLLRLGESFRPWFWSIALPRYLVLALGVFGLCGLGFWALEPRVDGLGAGLWLAFTTAATVGYGDIVPSTPASKIFAVFVVLLGVSVLSLLTAAIAAMWVKSEERQIEGEVLDALRRQLHELQAQIRDLHAEVRAGRPLEAGGATGPALAAARVEARE